MSELPIYEQARQAIAASIAHGGYTPGDRLPSEASFAADLGINRLTVRRAIEELARAGVVESRQGSGTYVCAPRVRLPLSIALTADSTVTSISSQIAAQGHACEHALVGTAKVGSGNNDSLDLPPGPLWRVDNALMVDGAPWMWLRSWFSRALLPDPAKNWDSVSGLSLQLKPVLGDLNPVWRSISADFASIEDSEILGVRGGTPLLVRDDLAANSDGLPVLRVCRRGRMDRISYVLEYERV